MEGAERKRTAVGLPSVSSGMSERVQRRLCARFGAGGKSLQYGLSSSKGLREEGAKFEEGQRLTCSDIDAQLRDGSGPSDIDAHAAMSGVFRAHKAFE